MMRGEAEAHFRSCNANLLVSSKWVILAGTASELNGSVVLIAIRLSQGKSSLESLVRQGSKDITTKPHLRTMQCDRWLLILWLSLIRQVCPRSWLMLLTPKWW